MDNEVYLGDAVYASFDGYQIRLRTGDGNNQTIFLDPSVLDSLIHYGMKIGIWRPGMTDPIFGEEE